MIKKVEFKDYKMAEEEQATKEEQAIKAKQATAAGISRPTTEAEALLDVDVEITVVLGTAMMPIAHVLKLGRGAVIELDRTVDEDIEVHANNRAVAKGEIIVIEDRLGVTMTEIIKTSI